MIHLHLHLRHTRQQQLFCLSGCCAADPNDNCVWFVLRCTQKQSQGDVHGHQARGADLRSLAPSPCGEACPSGDAGGARGYRRPRVRLHTHRTRTPRGGGITPLRYALGHRRLGLPSMARPACTTTSSGPGWFDRLPYRSPCMCVRLYLICLTLTVVRVWMWMWMWMAGISGCWIS